MANNNNNVEMTFWDHLEELRWVFIRSLAAIIVIGIVAFLNKEFIFDKIILAPRDPGFITNDLLCRLSQKFDTDILCLNQHPLKLINIKLAGQFTTHMYLSFVVGLFIGAPYVIFEFWRFIRPALRTNEKKHSSSAVLISSLLFIIGVLFGYYMIVPFTIDFLGSYQVSDQVENTVALGSYIQNVVSVSMAMGLIFEVPILVYFLTKIGVITPKLMRSSRKIVAIVLLVIAGIITPPDVISQILVTIPLFALYEISIIVSSRVYNRNYNE